MFDLLWWFRLWLSGGAPWPLGLPTLHSLGRGPTLVSYLFRTSTESLQSDQDGLLVRLVYLTDLSSVAVNFHHSVWTMERSRKLPCLSRLLSRFQKQDPLSLMEPRWSTPPIIYSFLPLLSPSKFCLASSHAADMRLCSSIPYSWRSMVALVFCGFRTAGVGSFGSLP